jgi:hypothetical protein
MSRIRLIIVGAMLCLVAERQAVAGTVAVRFPEGASHGYLTLVDEKNELVAQGELLQKMKGELVESRLVFYFKDGSLHDERVTFSQERIFKLLRYELVQRGPSFPEAVDIRLDQASGQYIVRSQTAEDGAEQIVEGRVKLPPDTYNGMLIMLLKNLQPRQTATVHLVVFTPKAKVVPIKLKPLREKTVKVGSHAKQARQYVLQPQLGAMMRFFGRLLGMIPAKHHYYSWILTDEVPAFLQFEGPLHLRGPIWKIELLNPTLPASLHGGQVH